MAIVHGKGHGRAQHGTVQHGSQADNLAENKKIEAIASITQSLGSSFLFITYHQQPVSQCVSCLLSAYFSKMCKLFSAEHHDDLCHSIGVSTGKVVYKAERR